MPIIKTFEKDEATGELAEIYNKIIEMRGEISNAHKILSSSPELIRQQMSFIKFYMEHTTLSQPLLASIRILVSSTHKCDFCIDFNTAILINMFDWTLEQVNQMKQDISKANLVQKDQAMLEFVIKSVKDPHSVEEDDVTLLKNLGWRDSDILDATAHGARMVAADILFNTFKVEDYA